MHLISIRKPLRVDEELLQQPETVVVGILKSLEEVVDCCRSFNDGLDITDDIYCAFSVMYTSSLPVRIECNSPRSDLVIITACFRSGWKFSYDET